MNQNPKKVQFGSLIARGAFVLAAAFGLQNAWSMECGGKNFYIEKPDSWTSAVVVMDGNALPLAATDLDPSGKWWVFSSDKGAAYSKEFFVMKENNGWNDKGITKVHFDVLGGAGGWDQADKIGCADMVGSDELYIYNNPEKDGETVVSTAPPNAKYFYVLIPEEQEWMGATPMISNDGGVTGNPMIADPSRCGWYYYIFFSEAPSDNVIIYRDDDEEKAEALGKNGTDEQNEFATPIDLATLYADKGVNTLFFIPDPENREDDDGSPAGFYTEGVDDIEGSCSYNLAAIIYDTDASLHPAFSCYQNPSGEGCQRGAQGISATAAVNAVNACIGVKTGIVEPLLSADKKPVLSAYGEECFISKDLFNQMFRPTPSVNEVTCYDLEFGRSADGKWEFNSDYYQSPGTTVIGGFYPAELDDATMNAKVVEAGLTPALPAARTKRMAEGPVFYGSYLTGTDPTEGVARMDLMCKGPGWPTGMDCNGVFADGDGTDAAFKKAFPGGGTDMCGFGWSCPDQAPEGWAFYSKGGEKLVGRVGYDGDVNKLQGLGEARWASTVGRNQHYCFESHANFVMKKGLRFTFRGDDDIWVFIGGRLAVDIGGTHLAAPGYANLDLLTDAAGNPLVEGQTYDIDIFFCDRRTTMSNVRIKTNMYIKQKTGLSAEPTAKDPDGSVSYNICYEVTGGASCAAAMATGGDSEEPQIKCGADGTLDMAVEYYVVNRAGDTVKTQAQVAALPGIDISNPYMPKINATKIGGLPPGNYRLLIVINGKKTTIKFRVKGNLDIVTQDVVYNPIDGDDVIEAYAAGTEWKFVGDALAGSRVPVYVSAVSETDIDLVSAVGQTYSLNVAAGVNVYTSKDGDAKAVFPRQIDETGVDTVWLDVPLAGLTANPEPKEVSLKTATTIKFHAPKLVFVRDIVKDSTGAVASYTEVTGDPDKDADGEDYYNWMGSDVELNLIAVNPITGEVCTECAFAVDLAEAGPAVPSRITAAVSPFNKGLASVTVLSEKVYYEPDPLAFITLAATENPELVAATYGNMRFREPPCPTPILVEVFDTKGEPTSSAYRIPEPLYSETREYLDGKADSISITYHRPFGKDESGSVPNDSLPDFICVNWDVPNDFELENFVFNAEKNLKSSSKKDSLVACSDTIGRAAILDAFKNRPNDSTLTFSGMVLSKEIKTADDGTGTGLEKVQVRNWATYEDRGKLVVSSFDKKISDRIAPVIMKAFITVDATDDRFDNIKFTFSEPVAAIEGGNLKEAFSYYVYSAATINAEKYPYNESRYLTPATLQDVGTGADVVSVRYLHGSADNRNATPQNGDYARFAYKVLSDTAGNAPTDYDAAIPSPWIQVTGEERTEIVMIPFNTLNPNDPLVQKFMNDKTVINVVAVDKFESDKATVSGAYKNMIGQLVKPDLAYFENSDKLTVSERGKKVTYVVKNPEDLVFKYEIFYFTNLGGFVASQKGEVKCTDESVYGAGENCMTSPKFLYLAWTGVTNDGRLVGTGAYISKISSHVEITGTNPESGETKKFKDGKKDQTNSVGFRRVSK